MDRDSVIRALAKINYPPYERDIVSFGMVKYVKVDGNNTEVRIFTGGDETLSQNLIKRVSEFLHAEFSGCKFNVILLKEDPAKSAPQPEKTLLQNAKFKIAVASGKGGVGKSTVAVNLARALARKFSKNGEARVGLMDCDVHGPSATILFGKKEYPMVDENRKIIPPEIEGIKVISMGMLVDDDQPLIWRGPMVSGALKQFAEEVTWGELDAMVFDLPPGTGDGVLSVVQTIPLSGAVIVTTPNNLAAQTAARGAMLFEKSNVKMLGVVENMSYFEMPDGSKEFIFGEGFAEDAAKKLGVDVLERVPIEKSLQTANAKESSQKIFDSLAEKVLAKLQ